MRVSRRVFLTGVLATGAVACARQTDAVDTLTSTTVAPAPAPGSTTTGSTITGSTIAGSSSVSTASGASGPSTAKGNASTSTSTTAGDVGRARFVDHGPTDTDKVALTFHTNGDLGQAQKLLDVFHDHGTVVTCFIVGSWLTANPTWAKKLTDAGHELANHTYTHPEFTALSAKAMLGEITKCRDTIAKLAGTDGGRYFRPSGTDDGTATPSDAILDAAGKAGYRTVLGWNDEPFDYKDPGADTVTARVLDQAKGGAIVSMHFGHPGTIAAMPAILDGLKAKNLRTVTVSDLLG